MSNSIIVHKHSAEDLVTVLGRCWEKGCESLLTRSSAPKESDLPPGQGSSLDPHTRDWELSKEAGDLGRQGHLVEIEVANEFRQGFCVLFVWFWSRA